MHMKKRTVIKYEPPVDVYYEYQYVLSGILDFLRDIDVLEMKPKVDEKNKAFLSELGIATFKDLFIANKEVVKKIYQNNRLFRFIIEAFSYLYERYERSTTGYYGKKAIDIINDGEHEFLERPINLFLVPRQYVRIYKAFKNHKKRKIISYFDFKRYINENADMLCIKGIGTSCELSLYISIIVDYKYWQHLKNI